MFYIPIILGSTRRERQSLKAARFIHERMCRYERVETEILDLLEYDFPIMEERLRFRDDPPQGLHQFSKCITRSDSLVIVAPEYNGGYPGVLKNALDYFLPEYRRKPMAIIPVSAGGSGGMSCLNQLRTVMFAIGAIPIPAAFFIRQVHKSLDDDGNPKDPSYEERSKKFIDELLWFTEAITTQKAKQV